MKPDPRRRSRASKSEDCLIFLPQKKDKMDVEGKCCFPCNRKAVTELWIEGKTDTFYFCGACFGEVDADVLEKAEEVFAPF